MDRRTETDGGLPPPNELRGLRQPRIVRSAWSISSGSPSTRSVTATGNLSIQRILSGSFPMRSHIYLAKAATTSTSRSALVPTTFTRILTAKIATSGHGMEIEKSRRFRRASLVTSPRTRGPAGRRSGST